MRSTPWLVVCTLFVPRDGHAQCEDKQIQKIGNPAPSTYNLFGEHLAFDGVTLVASARSTTNPTPGAVFVFEQVGAQFVQVAQLMSTDAVPGQADGFGLAVALDGDTLFVTAPYPQPHVGGQYFGAIYVWTRQQGAWTFRQKIVPPVPLGKFQGEAIGASSGWLVAAVPYLDIGQSAATVPAAGELLVYRRDALGTYQLHSTLTASALIQNQNLGVNLTIAGDTIAAASVEKTVGSSYGSINVFEFDGSSWSQTARLIPATAATLSGWFGVYGVGLLGKRIVGSSNSGHQFVFDKISAFWVESADVAPPPVVVTQDTLYGRPLALGNGVLVAGAPGDDAPFQNAGAAYVFTSSAGGWEPRIRLAPNDPTTDGAFGSEVRVAGSVVAVNSPKLSSGSAVYLMSATPNPKPEYGASCAGSAGYAPTLGLPLSFDGCFKAGDTATFEIEKGLGGSACLLLVGVAQAAVPLPGPCSLLVSPLPANATLPLFGFGPGNGAVSFAATLPSNLPSVSIYLQGFIPDTGAASGFSATNGLRLSVY